jgi:hypothetical protein
LIKPSWSVIVIYFFRIDDDTENNNDQDSMSQSLIKSFYPLPVLTEKSRAGSVNLSSVLLEKSPARSVNLSSVLLEKSPSRSVILKPVLLDPARSVNLLPVLTEKSPARSVSLSPVLVEKSPEKSPDKPLNPLTQMTCEKPTVPIETSTLEELANIDLDWFKDDLDFDSANESKVDSANEPKVDSAYKPKVDSANEPKVDSANEPKLNAPKDSSVSRTRSTESNKHDSAFSKLNVSSKPEETDFTSDTIHLADCVTSEQISNPSTKVRRKFEDDESALSGDTLDLMNDYNTLDLIAEDSKKRNFALKPDEASVSVKRDFARPDDSSFSRKRMILDLSCHLKSRGEVHRILVNEKVTLDR